MALPCLPQYVEDLIAGRRDECRRTALDLLEGGAPLRHLYRDLVEASLHEVGRRWEAGLVSVAVEHRATAITEELLALVFPRALRRQANGRTAVISCAAEELHQVGARIVADTLEHLGWSVDFVGAGAPLERLAELVRARRPQLVGLSVSIGDHLTGAEQAIEVVRAADRAVPIVVGGQAFGAGGPAWAARFPGVRHVPSLDELEALVEAWGT